jgi:hypothetical protein
MLVTNRPLRLAAALIAGWLLATPSTAEEDLLHHDLRVRLDPAAHTLAVEDELTVPAGWLDAGGDGLRFALHGGLQPQAGSGWMLEEIEGEPDLSPYPGGSEEMGSLEVPVREYRLRPGSSEVGPPRLIYQGVIHHPLVSEGEEYARSFSRTPGIIGEEGVVLSSSSWWLPTFAEPLVTFRMTVELPAGWDAVSQGKRTLHEETGGGRRVTWDSPHPMDDVYLVAAQFTEYSRPAGEATAYAFLRGPDPNLAAKYLEVTVQYLEMYRKLIGPYPYGKFALVENFWDTGYGMPSFTLLGPRIIRFPFILHSSYPHEILHNWWGNSVFVDYDGGNWCEGLTAYLADHLVKEGQGQGAAYRRDTLKKYRNFVRGENDFPLADFRSRHSSATEAVGYGKSLMTWHMLRREVGDEAFQHGLARFYSRNRFRQAAFADLETAFSEVAGRDLGPFFEQWVARTGAPALELADVRVAGQSGGAVRLSVEVRQTQAGGPYRLSVPVAVTVEGEEEAHLFSLDLSGERGTLQAELGASPRRVDVDPEFDLFRRLDPREIPASLGQLFGAERVTLVLPASDEAVEAARWEEFAATWAGGEENVEIVGEADLNELPRDRAVWILGRDAGWAAAVAHGLEQYGAGLDASSLRTGDAELPRAGHSFAFAVTHPEDADLALGWVGADQAAALPGLARKLPHYGKYSFVAFSGDEPTNVAKGQWPTLDSPMVRFVGEFTAAAALPARDPLARLEPVFDPGRLLARVRDLSADDMEGRGVGTAGLDRAAEYIAAAFREAGLEPGGDDGTYFQSWTEPGGPDGGPVDLRNVIGVLPGTDASWAEQSVVLGAHYDHLGRGWPDVRSGEGGKIHPGADDNASGVAVMLELADLLGRELEPRRTLLFAAFTAEEWGLKGSRHYVEAMRRWPAAKAMGMINLDTVGRLGDGEITVLGTGSASEWIHIVRGIGFTTGVEAQSVADDLGGSDQKSFLDAGVPAIQTFTGAHEDYHRPGDAVEHIDPAGMVKVATFVREAAVYLTEREDPMTWALASAEPARRPSGAAPSGRKVSLGTLPDFAFAGPGVKIDRVMPDTPAQAAGLEAGDLIVAIDGEEIRDLRHYAGILRERSPGDRIEIRLSRDGRELTVEATLVAR